MKLYIIDISVIILTQLSLKWLFFCLGIPKKFQEHDILTFSLLHVNNQDLIHSLHTCTAGSVKVALGIGNCTVDHKGHTCKLKMLLQIKNRTFKLKIVHAVTTNSNSNYKLTQKIIEFLWLNLCYFSAFLLGFQKLEE